jgi:hypothetical protein
MAKIKVSEQDSSSSTDDLIQEAGNGDAGQTSEKADKQKKAKAGERKRPNKVVPVVEQRLSDGLDSPEAAGEDTKQVSILSIV